MTLSLRQPGPTAADRGTVSLAPNASPTDVITPRSPAPEAKPAYSLRALGRNDLPALIYIHQIPYQHERTVKHDFWAATGFYKSESGHRIVVKASRSAPFAGIPLRWAGRILCQRELRFYRALADIPNVPTVLATIGRTTLVHEFAPGTPLGKGVAIPDGYFSQLQQLLGLLHERNIAYVDTNKCPNILVGDDGEPHLIDFQISYDLKELGNTFINRWILRRLQREDFYHILKHKLRLRPDEMTEEERLIASKPSPWIRFHRRMTAPYFYVRRRVFRRLRESGRLLPEGSE